MTLPQNSTYLANAPTAPLSERYKAVMNRAVVKFRETGIEPRMGAEIEVYFKGKGDRIHTHANEFRAALAPIWKILWDKKPFNLLREADHNYTETRPAPVAPEELLVNYEKVIAVAESLLDGVAQGQTLVIKSSHFTQSFHASDKASTSLPEQGMLQRAALAGQEQFVRDAPALFITPEVAHRLDKTSAYTFGIALPKSGSPYQTFRLHDDRIESCLSLRRKDTNPPLTVGCLLKAAWWGIENSGRMFSENRKHTIMDREPGSHHTDLTTSAGYGNAMSYVNYLRQTCNSKMARELLGEDLLRDTLGILAREYEKRLEASAYAPRISAADQIHILRALRDLNILPQKSAVRT